MMRGNAVDDIASRLDRLAIAGNAFMIDMTEDESALHPVRLTPSCCIATKLRLPCPATNLCDQSPVRMRSTNCFTVGTNPFE